MIENIEKIGIDFITYSRTVQTGPALLFSVIVTPTAGNVGVAKIYDGVNDSGILAMTISCPADQTLPIIFRCPLYLRDGIYVECTSNIRQITMQSQRC